MSHSTAPAVPSAGEPTCPIWCDPAYCLLTDNDVEHRSAPVAITAGDAIHTLFLRSWDELAHPEHWGQPPHLAMVVESTDLIVGTKDGDGRVDETPLGLSVAYEKPAELVSLLLDMVRLLARVQNPAAQHVETVLVTRSTDQEGRITVRVASSERQALAHQVVREAADHFPEMTAVVRR